MCTRRRALERTLTASKYFILCHCALEIVGLFLLFITIIIFFDPGTQFPGNEKKLRYKYKNQTGINLYSSSSSSSSLLLLLLLLKIS